MTPAKPLHRWQAGEYDNAASHSTSDAFAARQRARRERAQAAPVPRDVVRPIIKRKAAT